MFAISACGGTTQSTPTPASPTATERSSTASPPVSVPVASPSVEPSPAVSAPPVGTAWRKLEPDDGPNAREDHTWTLDPSTRTAYLFGGRDGNGSTATCGHSTSCPTPGESSTRAAKDPRRASVMRLSGSTALVSSCGPVRRVRRPSSTTSGRTTPPRMTGRASRTTGPKPVARYGSCSAIGTDGRLWISHGFTSEGVRFSDTRAYDFAAGQWTDETPDGTQPVVRCLHACWLTADGRFALYAGQTTGVRALGDLWALDDGEWSMVDGRLPPERNLPAATRHGDDTVVFGGLGLDGGYLRDVYRVDGTTLAFQELHPDGARPPARAGAAFIEDPGNGRLLLFGGTANRGAFDDIWQLALPERRLHQAALGPVQDLQARSARSFGRSRCEDAPSIRSESG